MMKAAATEERPNQDLIDVKEVARRLGVSETTIWDWSRKGTFLTPIYVGRLARWRVRNLDDWVEQQATAARSPKRRPRA
jgi:predicted DNA-binding transcriptional regulator AlpA